MAENREFKAANKREMFSKRLAVLFVHQIYKNSTFDLVDFPIAFDGWKGLLLQSEFSSLQVL